jgi:hypothetical protein
MSGFGRFFSVTLRVASTQPSAENATWVSCLNCGAPLEIHQPDVEEPQRFIGTCEQCRHWYVLYWSPLATEGLMLILPSYEELQAMHGPNGD